VRAHVRHAHTEYDQLLGRGIRREEARGVVAGAVAKRLEEWSRPSLDDGVSSGASGLTTRSS
jgi:hypothetical protein